MKPTPLPRFIVPRAIWDSLLAGAKQWCLSFPDDNEPKRPLDVNALMRGDGLNFASTNDPDTWVTLETAVNQGNVHRQKYGIMCYAGLVLRSEDPWLIFDYDRKRLASDPTAYNERLFKHNELQTAIGSTYYEVSQSGFGEHQLVYCTDSKLKSRIGNISTRIPGLDLINQSYVILTLGEVQGATGRMIDTPITYLPQVVADQLCEVIGVDAQIVTDSNITGAAIQAYINANMKTLRRALKHFAGKHPDIIAKFDDQNYPNTYPQANTAYVDWSKVEWSLALNVCRLLAFPRDRDYTSNELHNCCAKFVVMMKVGWVHYPSRIGPKMTGDDKRALPSNIVATKRATEAQYIKYLYDTMQKMLIRNSEYKFKD